MDIEERAKAIRRAIVKMHYKAKAPHVGSTLSCVDVLTALYFKAMKRGDRFVLSKGHAASGLYAVLSEKGVFPKGFLRGFCVDGGKLQAHADRKVPGVEFSTGSLGYGLSVAQGLALAARLDGRKARVFVLLSDGECDEGSVWEAAMSISHYKLDNLVAIVDYNGLQAFGRTSEVLGLEPFAEKWRAFGFGVREVDGHNLDEVAGFLSAVPFEEGRPSVVIAHTVKGKGVSFMENRVEWHYKVPDKSQFEAALRELE